MPEAHRKQLRRFEQVPRLDELTFSYFRRKPLLTNDGWRGLLSTSLNLACAEETFQLAAFVFMPEHVHLLVLPRNTNARIGRLLARTKQPVSKQVREMLEDVHSPLLEQLTVQERPGKQCFRFWQEGAGFDRNVFSREAVAASIDYIHANPVRRGLCLRTTDFKWSSARFYLQNTVDPELPLLTRPDPEWFHGSGIQVEII